MDQKEEGMRLICWSLVGLILMGIAFALSAYQAAKEFTGELREPVYVNDLDSSYFITDDTACDFPEIRIGNMESYKSEFTGTI